MSKTSHRRRRAHRHETTDRIAILAAWCQHESDFPEARKGAHDALIAMMGDRRAGRVEWHHFEGDAARDLLATLKEGATPELFDHYRHLGAFLREYGGWIVTASAAERA